MDIFLECGKINDLLNQNNEKDAKNELIKLLDFCKQKNIDYDSLINHLIRRVGLYPYLKTDSASWQDRFVHESFKVDVGEADPVTLHREQSSILSKLLSGQSLIVSAPTSFGKSFIIDALISIKKPNNIMIIVPTIALMDETRRRLQNKFSNKYKIITTSEIDITKKNIFIFPQERATHYINKISTLDILIVDEFYKASIKFDKNRAPSLMKAILKFGTKAKQKYFLAPNISKLKNGLFASRFTQGMDFIFIDFNTVYLEEHNLYLEIDINKKDQVLIDILNQTNEKSLIYAGTYKEIKTVSDLLIKDYKFTNTSSCDNILKKFSQWLSTNYSSNWNLVDLVRKGCGIHNGNLHRSLSQIQIKLFEEENGLKNIISTSSIIEGVNTSAKNIIIWKSKNGPSNLNNFTYKNIIGRGGRMFKHFVGKIYILEKPPKSEETQLSLELPEALLVGMDENDTEQKFTSEERKIISDYKMEISDILDFETFKKLREKLESSDLFLIKNIAKDIKENKEKWNGLSFLNSGKTDKWDNYLYRIIDLKKGSWAIKHTKFIQFVKILSKNWEKSIPTLIAELVGYSITIDDFFKLERQVTFDLAALSNDVNILQKEILKNDVDIALFVSNVSHAFLPPVVYRLEEYGLPRMIARKIQLSNILNFEGEKLGLHTTINKLKQLGVDEIIKEVRTLDEFDKYILNYFFEGI